MYWSIVGLADTLSIGLFAHLTLQSHELSASEFQVRMDPQGVLQTAEINSPSSKWACAIDSAAGK
jgi:hypothetical protein